MTVPALEPGSYADFGALTTLKAAARDKDAAALRETARQFESLFTRMLLKSMREASLGEGLGESEQTQFYQDMYDQQLAVELSRGDGIGLAQKLVEQLTRAGAVSSPQTQAAEDTTGTAADKTTFINRIRPAAEQAAARLGVATESVIAQAALETGWGRHMPADARGSSNNLFGIKATGWDGAQVSSGTLEYDDGAMRALSQPFRSYASVEDGMRDYVSLLSQNSRYADALNTGSDVGAFADALQRGGYATDPDYATKLRATAESVRALLDTSFKSGGPAPIANDRGSA